MTDQEFYRQAELIRIQLEANKEQVKFQAKIQAYSLLAERHIQNGFISLGDGEVIEALFDGKIEKGDDSKLEVLRNLCEELGFLPIRIHKFPEKGNGKN
jgi:hypothetical protein